MQDNAGVCRTDKLEAAQGCQLRRLRALDPRYAHSRPQIHQERDREARVSSRPALEPPAWSRWHSKGHGRHAGTVSFAPKPWAHLLPSVCTAWPRACGGSRGATRTPGTACGRTASTCGGEGKLTSHPGWLWGTCPRRAEAPSPCPSLRPPSLSWGSLSEGCLPQVPPTQPSQGHHRISRLPCCLELQAQTLSGSQQVIWGRSLPDAHRGSCSQGTLALRDAPLAVQHVRDAGLGDDGVITFEPLVLVLSDEAGVVAALQGPLVVDHRKQRVPDGMAAGTRRSLNPVTTWDHIPIAAAQE